jgi:DNA-binding transcriptional ArsR family regulator
MDSHNGGVPIQTGRPACRTVAPSAPSELAWLLNLLVQTAPYAEPALAELHRSLLPGITQLRRPIKERFEKLWGDELAGCPELVYAAHQAKSLFDSDPNRLFSWLEAPGSGAKWARGMLAEPDEERPVILNRLRALRDDAKTRRAYREILIEVWRFAASAWDRTGRAAVVEACAAWETRLATGAAIEDLVPPRHPLTRADHLGFDDLFVQRTEFALSPLYFCLSGGHVIDLYEFVHIAVPASDLLPVRKVRDAAYISDRLRVLAEPTRVHILIQLFSAPSGVMELARALRLSQPTVSGHVKILRDAGLVQARRFGARTVMVPSRRRVERLIEDARATLARWD